MSSLSQSHHHEVLPGPAHRSQSWYNAYMAALFESDRTGMAERIRSAEQLIVNRERELFTGSGNRAERDALAHALQALQALRSCLRL
jgi:hypothetical protein